jgi:UV DNA damage endonuclease
VKEMIVRLGYVAISMKLNITSSSMMTYSHYQRLGEKKGLEKLNKVIMSNFRDLETILKYNIKNNITFYRLTSNLIPLLTHPEVNININKYKIEFEYIGKIIKENKMRIDTHPDQFCVLNSINDNVVEASIIMLKSHQEIFKLLKYNGRMILHIGSSVGGKEEALNRFKNKFNKLDKDLQKMIILENDDKVFNIEDTLMLCEDLHIPMVLDYHHYLCNNNGEKIENYITRILDTWHEETPKMHFSSPKNKKEIRAHNDYIDVDTFVTFIKKIKFVDRNIDIMLEAKMKDIALFRLMEDIKQKTNYEIINESTFLVK